MNFGLILPELVLVAGALAVFCICLGENRARAARLTATATAVAALAASLFTLNCSGLLFDGCYKVDLFSQFFKVAILVGLLAVLLIGRDLKGIAVRIRPEYDFLLLCSALGLTLLVSSVELVTLLVALELSSFAMYLLVPLRDDTGTIRMQMESATKYIMFGFVATGIMLYGMSYIYGLAGSTYLADILPRLHAGGAEPLVLAGIALFMAGIFFKLAVFPFHFWAPDVYEGASNETTAYIASVPKLGAVAILIRVAVLNPPGSDTIAWVLAALAVCSMFYGNLSALVQKDLKRMLAFSGIAHAGYFLFGLVIMKPEGYAYAIFYAVAYALMTLMCLLVAVKVSREGENVAIADLAGLYKRSPLLAATLGVGMFALAGIPPFVGFMGKFLLLSGGTGKAWIVLVLLALINTAIAIYYYLSVVRVTYCTDPEDRPAIALDTPAAVAGVCLILVVLALGVVPGPILDLATAAVRTLF